MKIPQKDYVEQDQIGMFKQIGSTISEKNLSLVLDNVTKNLYSDPIGAFVRELTSNAVDANKRNSKSEKVKVRIYKEAGSVYFEVKDEGTGMTPEVFESVYMSWFESDKRYDNGQIGGWGIGSKSPLAYAEYYELTTIANGIQYEYEIVRQAPAPTASLVSQKETNKKSGTTVRVEVSMDDDYKLHRATVRQLVYFDNVIVTNEVYYYDNHFKIIDHPLFVVRSDGNYPFDKDMHIVIGQVAYPIDWNILGITPVRVPVAIKFDIGDIPVNLDREKIHYADEITKDKIKNKIRQVRQILVDLYIEKVNVTSFYAYIQAINNPKTTIELAGYKIPFGIQLKNTEYKLHFGGYSFSFSKDLTTQLMSAFQVIDLSAKEGKNKMSPSFQSMFGGIAISEYCYSPSRELNHWSSLFRKQKFLVRRIPMTRSIMLTYAAGLGLMMESTRFGKFKRHLKSGAVKQVMAFVKAMEQYFTKNYPNYDIVPEEFIEQEKAKQEALKQERKGNITHYNLKGNKIVESVSSLMDNYDYVFYLNREVGEEKIRAYSCLFDSFDDKIKKFVKLIVIAPSTINKIKNKTKSLTLKQKIVSEGKKKTITATKEINAFLSAEDKVFRFMTLYKQFHKLRYTTILEEYGLNAVNSSVSKYYLRLTKSIPTTLTYRIKASESWTTEYIYPYHYFKKEIDAITKNRNYHHEKALEELTKVAPHLLLISKMADMDNHGILINRLIKTYKLTKLNTHYYGNK